MITIPMSLHRSIALATTAAILATACSAPSTPSVAPSETVDVAPIESEGPGFKSFVADFVGDSPGGLAVVNLGHGSDSSVAVGAANTTGELLTPETPFRVGSISKTFVATMIMQLVDEGAINLDTTADHYLPGVPLGRESTIGSLLNHTSGLPNYTDSDNFLEAVFTDRSRSFSPGELLDFASRLEPSDPGDFAYSNTNYILLGLVIEQLDDQPLNDSLTERITEPLGLTSVHFSTGIEPVPGLPAGWSEEFDLSGDPSFDFRSIASAGWSAGSLISTTQDLAAFLSALFDGQLVSPDSLAAMTDVSDTGYGFGLFPIDSGDGSVLLGHDGVIPGFLSIMAIDVDTGAVVVVLTNDDSIDPSALVVLITREW